MAFFILHSSFFISSCIGGSVADGQQSPASDSTKVISVDSTLMGDVAAADSTAITLTQVQYDSIVFRLTHHYTLGYNFVVTADDSLRLLPHDTDPLHDTCYVRSGDVLAVAEIKMMPTDTIDSVWVKVARDQMTMGWVPERELLSATTPDDTVSQVLHALSSSRAVWMTALVLIGITLFLIRRRRSHTLQLLKFRQMSSPYPFLFLATVAIMASIYASVQNLVPEFWQEYYYYPTLNPLVLPPVMAVLLATTWLVVILFLAVVDEVYHHFYLADGVAYLLELVSIAMILYLLVSWTTLIYIGYPILLVLLALLLWLAIVAVARRTR